MLQMCPVCLLMKDVLTWLLELQVLSLEQMPTVFALDLCNILISFLQICKMCKMLRGEKYTLQCFANENTPNEPHFTLSCLFNILGDYNRNPQESLNIKLFILATPQPVRVEMQAGPIYISCDPQQHVVMLANQI